MPLAGVTVVKVREQEAQETAGPDQTCRHLINTKASNCCVNAQVILTPSSYSSWGHVLFHVFKGEHNSTRHLTGLHQLEQKLLPAVPRLFFGV